MALHFFPLGLLAASYGVMARLQACNITEARIAKSKILIFIVTDFDPTKIKTIF